MHPRLPSTWTAQSMAPIAVTRITNALVLSGWVASVVEPNDAMPRNSPVTRTPPRSSSAMAWAFASSVPSTWMTQSMAPDAVTCITNAATLPRAVSLVAPNDALPEKSPAMKAPPA